MDDKKKGMVNMILYLSYQNMFAYLKKDAL